MDVVYVPGAIQEKLEPMVSIKRVGSTVVSRKIVKYEWRDTLGAIVKRVDPSLSHAVVENELVSSNAL